jgi:23S rRNA-/tRNA-specific pseudouridylate synthase
LKISDQFSFALADAGLPVVGDPFYNPYQLQRILHGCAVDGWDFANLSLKQWLNPQVGLGLQAFHLEFPNPVAGLHLNSIQPSDPGAKVLYECSNNTVRVSVPLPDEWASLNPRSVDAML